MIWNPVEWVRGGFTKLLRAPINRAVDTAIATTPPKQTTRPDPFYADRGSRQFTRLTVANDIISARQDCWNIYLNDGDASAQIDGIGLDACATDNEGLPFQIVPKRQADNPYRKDPKTGRRVPSPEQEAITEVYDRLQAKLDDIGLYDGLATSCAMAVNQGEFFDEIVWDIPSGEALRMERIPFIRDGAMMRPLYEPSTMTQVGWRLLDLMTGEVIRDFRLWEVMRYEWNQNVPLLAPIRLQWKMLQENEQDLYAARQSRAFAKLIRVYKNKSWEQLAEFIAQEEEYRRKHPVGPDSDLVTNADEVELLDPSNVQLSKVDDLEYRRRQVLTAGRKPKGLLAGHGKDINRATLDKQDEGYIRLLTRVNSMANRPIRQFLRIQLVLWGYDPDEYPFQLKWTEKNTKEFESLVKALDILGQRYGLSNQTILSEAGFDYEDELDRREYESEVEPGQDAMLDRILKEVQARNDPSQNGNGQPAQNGNRVQEVGRR